jgi:hypothetical protein
MEVPERTQAQTTSSAVPTAATAMAGRRQAEVTATAPSAARTPKWTPVSCGSRTVTTIGSSATTIANNGQRKASHGVVSIASPRTAPRRSRAKPPVTPGPGSSQYMSATNHGTHDAVAKQTKMTRLATTPATR